MLISYLDLDGGQAAFNAGRFVRLRPSFGDSDPPGTVTIRLDAKRFHSASDASALVGDLKLHLPICQLTIPNGATNWIAAARILNISAPISQHHPSAHSVVSLQTDGSSSVDYALQETVADAQAIIAQSLADWPSN